MLGAYRRLLLAYTLNEFAWAVGTLALSYLVYRRTGSAIGAAGFYLCSQFVPALLAPLFVARIDRWHPRIMLPILYGCESVSFAVLGVIARHFALPAVLGLALVDGLFAQAARPIARSTTVAVTSGAGLLREGNAVTNTCFSIAFLTGPAIGGAVVALGGATAALFVNAGLFLVIALNLITSTGLPAPEVAMEGAKHRLRAALAHVRRHHTLGLLLSLQAVGILFFTMSVPVEVVYAQHSLHAGAGGYGAIMSGWGAGALAGSAVYARWRQAPSRTLMVLGAALIGLGLVGMAASPTLAPAIAAAVVAGVGNGTVATATRTALQEATEAGWMTLVMAFSESASEAMPGVGIVLGGAITALSGARPALAVGGAGALAVAAATWVLLHPRRERLEPAADSQRL